LLVQEIWDFIGWGEGGVIHFDCTTRRTPRLSADETASSMKGNLQMMGEKHDID